MRPDQYIEVRIVRRHSETIHAIAEIDEETARVLDALPKDREIDPREEARAVVQRQQRDDLTKRVGGWLAGTILRQIQHRDTVRGYPQEGKAAVEPFDYVSLGHSLARLMVGHPFMMDDLKDFPRGDELADLLVRYAAAEDRWSRDPNKRPNPFKEVNEAIDLLKRLNLPPA